MVVKTLEIEWLNGKVTRQENLAANQLYKIDMAAANEVKMAPRIEKKSCSAILLIL